MATAQIDIPLDRIRDFCRRWKIREFSLFGSVLRDDFRPDSDVDVLVSFFEDAEWDYWDGWPEMRDELEAMFGRKVDFVEKEALANPIRRDEILRTRQVVYAC
jgi:predicted nucleotidyltransferase